MNAEATVSNALTCAVLDGIAASAEERARLLAEAGLADQPWDDITARTPILAFARLWDAILRTTADDFVGMRIGANVRGDRFGLAAHAAQNSDDVRQALLRFVRFASLINDLIRCELIETADVARFTMAFRWDVLDLERHAVDITFVALVAWLRDHVDGQVEVREVRLRHGRREAGPLWRDRVGASARFGCETNEVRFDPAVLDRRLGAVDPQLGRILDRYATAELARVPVVADLAARIAQIVRRELEVGRSVELDDVADELRMSRRHVQRKLKDCGTSFTALRDEARRSLAPKLLRDPRMNVEQVGFRLGYSEPTAFIRAFRKWFRMTPGEYRRS